MKNETVAKKKVDVSSFALYIGAVLILICFTIVCKIAGKDFLTLRNIQNIISQSSCVALKRRILPPRAKYAAAPRA